MPYLDLNGERIYFALHRNQSDGIPVLLIHGAGENHLVWPIGLRRLPGMIVYGIDLPGHGKSTGSGRASIEEYAAWLSAFMSAAGLARAILIGHSMGGAITQFVALKYPDRVLGLVLVATSARLRVSPQLLQLAQNDFTAAVDLISQWEWGSLMPDEIKQAGKQQLLTIAPRVVLNDYKACDAFDVRTRLHEIIAVTLIVSGEADQMTPLKHAQFLAERLPHARLMTVPQAGHMVMLEASEVVTHAVEEFVRDIVKHPA